MQGSFLRVVSTHMPHPRGQAGILLRRQSDRPRLAGGAGGCLRPAAHAAALAAAERRIRQRVLPLAAAVAGESLAGLLACLAPAAGGAGKLAPATPAVTLCRGSRADLDAMLT